MTHAFATFWGFSPYLGPSDTGAPAGDFLKDEEFVAMRTQLGALSVRVACQWEWVQPDGAGGASNFGWLDAIISRIWANSMSPLVYVYKPDDNPQDPRWSDAGWWWLCNTLATRYSLPYLEIWNEPNGPHPSLLLSPQHYKRRLEWGCYGARSGGARVVIGGLSSKPGPGHHKPKEYLQQLKNAGLQPIFYDCIALHPYGANPGEVYDHVREVHDWAQPIGWLNGKELWVTEFGWQTYPPQGPGAEWSWTSRDEQANKIVNAMYGLPHESVKRVYIFTWRDFCNQPGAAGNLCRAGILDEVSPPLVSPKPAYNALDLLH